MSEVEQLSLLDLPPDPPPSPPPSSPLALTFRQVEHRCMDFVQSQDRQGLQDFLSQLILQGKAESVDRLLKLRPDFGFKLSRGVLVPTVQPGDRVRILKDGQFHGKFAGVVAVEADHVVVKGENWVVTHTYAFHEVRFMSRRKQADDERIYSHLSTLNRV